MCLRNHFLSVNLSFSPPVSLSLSLSLSLSPGRALAGLLWEQQQTGSHIPSFRFFLAHSPFIFMHSSSINTHKHVHKRQRAKTCLKQTRCHWACTQTHTHTYKRTYIYTITPCAHTQSHPVLIHYRFSPGEVFVFGWSIKPFWHYNFWHTKAINTISSIQMCIWFGFSGLIRTNDCRDELKNTPILLFRHVIITIKHLTRNMEHQ